MPALATRVRVLILQHPQEQDLELGSARLVALALPGVRLSVGLSWPTLQRALGEEADPRRWVALYPFSLPRELTPGEQARPAVLLGRRGAPARPADVDGIVVLDGTWSQAKTLWWRNPWLLKLGRVVLHPREASIYGRVRREPQRHYLSTLESVAEALVALGEPEEVRTELRRLFRTMVQRSRDACAGGVL
jgi:hypothetical protein